MTKPPLPAGYRPHTPETLAPYLAGIPALAAILGGGPEGLAHPGGRRRQSQPRVHRQGTRGRRRRQAGAALCAAGRRELAAAAVALALRTSGAHRSRPGWRPGWCRPCCITMRRLALIAMELLEPHIIMRKGLVAGDALSALRRGHHDLHGANAVLLRPTSRFPPTGRRRGIARLRRQPRAVQDHRGPDLHRSLPRRRAEPLDVSRWLDAIAAALPRGPRSAGRGLAAQAEVPGRRKR